MTLQDHVFAHGQAYVALSRVRSRNDIRILTSAGFVLNSQPHVHNVVYPELLDATHVTLSAPFFPIVDIHPGLAVAGAGAATGGWAESAEGLPHAPPIHRLRLPYPFPDFLIHLSRFLPFHSLSLLSV